MALIARLARLWRADMNALLDRLEAPDLVLAQSVREMEQALDTDRRALARLARECERLAALDSGLGDLLAQTESALEDALAEGRDDLARPLIRRRLETEQRRTALGRRLSGIESEREALARRVAERSERLEGLRARAAVLADSDRSDTGPAEDWTAIPPSSVREEDIEIALLQAKRRRGAAR